MEVLEAHGQRETFLLLNLEDKGFYSLGFASLYRSADTFRHPARRCLALSQNVEKWECTRSSDKLFPVFTPVIASQGMGFISGFNLANLGTPKVRTRGRPSLETCLGPRCWMAASLMIPTARKDFIWFLRGLWGFFGVLSGDTATPFDGTRDARWNLSRTTFLNRRRVYRSHGSEQLCNALPKALARLPGVDSVDMWIMADRTGAGRAPFRDLPRDYFAPMTVC